MSNLFINWSGVGFTPTGGSLTPVVNVTHCKFDDSGSPEMFKGDASKYLTMCAVPDAAVSAEVSTGDATALSAVANGTVGTLVATLNHALNGATAGGGAKLYTLSNAVLVSKGSDGAHGKYGAGSLKFVSYSSDGTTNPLAVTAV